MNSANIIGSVAKLSTKQIVDILNMLKWNPVCVVYMAVNIVLPFSLFFYLFTRKYDIKITVEEKGKGTASKIEVPVVKTRLFGV